MTQKIFLLGVGCQKGGTTWIHKYLSSHPQCEMGLFKEYHVLDVKYLEELPERIYLHKKALTDLRDALDKKISCISNHKPQIDRKLFRAIKLAEFHTDITSYADYFSGIARPDGVRVVGDITPSYCGLEKEHLSEVKALLESRGFTVRVLYLMRDPIERIFSMCRMLARDQAKRSATSDSSPAKLFSHYYSEVGTRIRTEYVKTIENIESVFDPKDIHLEFYETLFEEVSIKKIDDFLGIDHAEPNFGEIVNDSPSDEELDKDTVGKVRAFYAHVYDYCSDRFGSDFIREIWKNA